jgi:2-polyprenyl-6-methoxyphenol hydroxylase-like FAD-dependent oxidoreductase
MAGEAVLNGEHINGVDHSGLNGDTGRSKSKTGIKVLIVGAGFGGLCAAIECHRQGHDVELYESFKELKVLGDIISFGANAGRIFRRWFIPGTEERIIDRLDPLSIKRNILSASGLSVQVLIK